MNERQDIIQLAARHSVLTIESVKSCLFHGKSESAPRKALESALRNGQLKAFKLDAKHKIYQLSKKSVTELGLPRGFGEALGERVLAGRLAILRYGTQSGRTVLLRDEFNRHFKDLVTEQIGFEYCTYYIREDKEGYSLHRFAVDLGAAPKSVVDRILAFLAKAQSSPTLIDMIEAGAFGFTIIVPTPTKRDAIRKILAGGPFQNGYRVDVEITVVQNNYAKHLA